jgi:hypothetical protein
MSEQKGNGFKRLFFKENKQEAQEAQTQETQKQPSKAFGKKPNTGGGLLTPIKTIPTPVMVNSDNNLISDFVEKMQELMNQNNQSGFDFLEFTETLFEESQNPSEEEYKLVFRIAKKMDKTLTADKLIQSANFYKSVIQQSADGEIIKGQNKKSILQNEKDNERKVLEKTQSDANTQIEKLNAQILTLQMQANDAYNKLNAIDQKYENDFADIDTKLSSISAAKEQVISSIIDIETGISNNLK